MQEQQLLDGRMDDDCGMEDLLVEVRSGTAQSSPPESEKRQQADDVQQHVELFPAFVEDGPWL